MYCKKCGAEISDRAFICKHCGSKVQDIDIKPKGENRKPFKFLSDSDEQESVVAARVSKMVESKNEVGAFDTLEKSGEDDFSNDSISDSFEVKTAEEIMKDQKSKALLKAEQAVAKANKATEQLEKARNKKTSYENIPLSQSIIDDGSSFLSDDNKEESSESFLAEVSPTENDSLFLADQENKANDKLQVDNDFVKPELKVSKKQNKKEKRAERKAKESEINFEPEEEISFVSDEPLKSQKTKESSSVRNELNNNRKNERELVQETEEDVERRASRRTPIRAAIRMPVETPAVIDTIVDDKDISDDTKSEEQPEVVELSSKELKKQIKQDLTYPIFTKITVGGVMISVFISILLFICITGLTMICSIRQSVMQENVSLMTEKLNLNDKLKDTYVSEVVDFDFLSQLVSDNISVIMLVMFAILIVYLVALLLRINIVNQKLVLLYGALPCIFSGSILYEASANYTKFYMDISNFFDLPEEVVSILCELVSGTLGKISLFIVVGGIVLCALLVILIIVDIVTSPDRAGNQDRMQRVFGH